MITNARVNQNPIFFNGQMTSLDNLSPQNQMNGKIKLLYTTPEAPPYMQQGGLGTVAGSFPKALQETGNIDVTVVTPYFVNSVRRLHDDGNVSSIPEKIRDCFVPFGDGLEQFAIYEQELKGVRHIFIGHKEFDGPDPYSYSGTYSDTDKGWMGRRFALFSRMALEAARSVGFYPDIIQGNDWTTAMMPAYLKSRYAQEPAWAKTRFLMTVHSALHQGQFERNAVAEARLPDGMLKEFEFNGKINFLVGALRLADAVNTVSPSYLTELLTAEQGAGVENIFRWVSENKTFAGILNGNDYEINDPRTNKKIPSVYSPNDLTGKQINKQMLLREVFGSFDRANEPIALMIGRLTEQKGIHVLAQSHVELMQRGLKLAVMGVKDKGHVWFGLLDNSLNSKVRAFYKFDLDLAPILFAGADIFLMPSRAEPCGIAQMEAMAYGLPPIVNNVGGLKDTVTKFNPSAGEGLGFVMKNYSVESFLTEIDRALDIYYGDPQNWRRLVENCMNVRYTWESSAKAYAKLYSLMM